MADKELITVYRCAIYKKYGRNQVKIIASTVKLYIISTPKIKSVSLDKRSFRSSLTFYQFKIVDFFIFQPSLFRNSLYDLIF